MPSPAMGRSTASSSTSSTRGWAAVGRGGTLVSMSSQAIGGSHPRTAAWTRAASTAAHWLLVIRGGAVFDRRSYSAATSRAVRAVTDELVMMRRKLPGRRRSSSASSSEDQPMRREPVIAVECRSHRLDCAGLGRRRQAVLSLSQLAADLGARPAVHGAAPAPAGLVCVAQLPAPSAVVPLVDRAFAVRPLGHAAALRSPW